MNSATGILLHAAGVLVIADDFCLSCCLRLFTVVKIVPTDAGFLALAETNVEQITFSSTRRACFCRLVVNHLAQTNTTGKLTIIILRNVIKVSRL
jgi:hypothetical protein